MIKVFVSVYPHIDGRIERGTKQKIQTQIEMEGEKTARETEKLRNGPHACVHIWICDDSDINVKQ